MKKPMIWVLVLLLTVHLVLGLGIRPAKTNLISEEISSYANELWIVNNDAREFSVSISLRGEMSQYVSIDKNELHFRSDDSAKSLKFSVNLPETVPPGTSTAEIVIEERLAVGGENIISSKLILKHVILIQGPYPDKYITTKLNFHESGDEIRFVSEVENLGKKNIESIKTTFFVNDKKLNAQTFETEQTTLETRQNKLLSSQVQRDLFELGEFEVSAVTTYDDQKVEVVKKLLVGRPEVEVVYFDKYFIANKINQYSMDLLNKWNRPITNVYVDVEVKRDNQKIDSFRTKSVDIEAEIIKRIQEYYDARGKNQGSYSFEMIVNFWNLYRMETKTFNTEFIAEEEYTELEVAPSNIAGKATGKLSTDTSNYAIMFWILMGILLGAGGFFVFWRYIHRDQYDGGEDSVL
jgi:hypothetical protein